jgi:hypothetical protein
MTCPAAIIRRYETREQVREYLAREASGAPLRAGGTADGSDTSAATMAASGSRSGCRPRRAPHSREGVVIEQGTPDAHVQEAVRHQIDHPIVELQINQNLRIGCQKLRQCRRYVTKLERHRGREADTASRCRRFGLRLGLDRFTFGKDLCGSHLMHPADLGQREATGGAMDQSLPEPRFRPSKCFRHRRTGDAKFSSRGGKRAGLRDPGEDGPRFKVRQRHETT